MGTRFRKSVKLPGGFRVNFSKSGVGYSWGVKGYRKTKTATGRTRTTYSIPGTGLSHVEESKKASAAPKSAPPADQTQEVKKPITLRWWYLLITVLLFATGVYGVSTSEDPALATVLIGGAIIMLIVRISAAKNQR